MTTKRRISDEEALAVLEDESTDWPVIRDLRDQVEIRAYVLLRERAGEMVDDAVVCARKRGLTWIEIGNALGVSPQAARKKYVDRV